MASRNLYVFEKCVDIGIISPILESNIIYTLSKNIFKCDGKWYVEEDEIQEENIFMLSDETIKDELGGDTRYFKELENVPIVYIEGLWSESRINEAICCLLDTELCSAIPPYVILKKGTIISLTNINNSFVRIF